MIKVKKRDSRIKTYDEERIFSAISRAYDDFYGEKYNDESVIGKIVDNVTNEIHKFAEKNKTEVIEIETIQDIVIKNIKKINKDVAKCYKKYREDREKARSANYLLNIKDRIIDTFSSENSNANVDENNFGGKELRIVEEIEKEIANVYLPQDIVEYNKRTILKQHDYAKTVLGQHNCLLMDYVPLLKNGFKTRQGDTKPANSYQSACQLLAVMIQSQSLDMFGGCGLMNFSIYMIPWLKKTISQITKDIIDVLELNINDISDELSFQQSRSILGDNYYKAEKRIKKTVSQTNQALITNLVTLQSRSGHQLPFSSINIGLIDPENEDESAFLTEYMLLEMSKGIGKYNRTPIFPILCFQVKSGINRRPEDKYYYLRMLAQEVAHKRMYPTIVNCDWSGNKASCWEEEMNLMG